jgi:hypothetical protein
MMMFPRRESLCHMLLGYYKINAFAVPDCYFSPKMEIGITVFTSAGTI